MRRWLNSVLFVLLAACSGKNDVPSGVLQKDKMEEVVWDIIQADQHYREFMLKDSAGKDINQMRYTLYEDVFKIHKISKETFDKSFAYYSNRPQLMKDIFDSLSVKGNRRLQDFYKPAIPANDSISIPKRLGVDSIRPQ